MYVALPASQPAEGPGRARRDGRHRARRRRRGRRGRDRGDADARSAVGARARAPSCARTARRSACRATTTWATARSATTRSAPARSTRRARCSSAARSSRGALFEGEAWQRGDRARRARRRGPLPRPALRRQRPLAPRSPRGDARPRPRRPAARSSTSTRCSTAATCRRRRRWNTSIAPSGFSQACAQSGIDARIVSGGGRMQITMDRYEADWAMVERGWHTHVLADARAVRVGDARRSRRCAPRTPASIDQDLPRVRRRAARADAGRRRVRDVQLPRRPRDRDLARVRRRRSSTSSIACAGPTCSTPA